MFRSQSLCADKPQRATHIKTMLSRVVQFKTEYVRYNQTHVIRMTPSCAPRVRWLAARCARAQEGRGLSRVVQTLRQGASASILRIQSFLEQLYIESSGMQAGESRLIESRFRIGDSLRQMLWYLTSDSHSFAAFHRYIPRVKLNRSQRH